MADGKVANGKSIKLSKGDPNATVLQLGLTDTVKYHGARALTGQDQVRQIVEREEETKMVPGQRRRLIKKSGQN